MQKRIVGAVLAISMLAAYAAMLIYMIGESRCLGKECGDCKPPLSDNFVWLFNTVSGLVSAVVIAELAATPAGQMIGRRVIPAGVSPTVRSTAQIVAGVFLGAWVLCGLAAVYFGLFGRCDNSVPLLTNYAKAWVGIALGAVYAYFGVQPANGGGGHA